MHTYAHLSRENSDRRKYASEKISHTKKTKSCFVFEPENLASLFSCTRRKYCKRYNIPTYVCMLYATSSTRVSDIANNRLSGEYGSRESYHLSWVYMRQLSLLILREKEQKSERGERWYWGQIGKLVKLFDFGLINHPIDPRKRKPLLSPICSLPPSPPLRF